MLWTAHLEEKDQALAYAVTSIETNPELRLGEYGYFRDRKTLPKLNIGIFNGTKTALSICHEIYRGSILDKAFFPYMMELSELVDFPGLF